MTSNEDPTKVKSSTCALCRQRKLRCDGRTPCAPCTRTRKPVVCTYPSKTINKPAELPKGAACVQCRGRKRKCDGNKPCHTCAKTSKADKCEYRSRTPPRKRLRNPPDYNEYLSTGARTSSTRSTSPPRSNLSFAESLECLSEYVLTFQDNGSEILLPPPGSAFPLSHSVGSDKVPTNGEVAAPLLSTDIQPPKDRAAELFRVRNLFLEHGWQYGLNIPTEKRDAISRGDASGHIVHPVLIHVCQLLGYLLANHSHEETWVYFQGQTDAEAEQAAAILDFLEGTPSLVPDPLTSLQAYTMLAIYCAQKVDLEGFRYLLAKAGEVVVEHQAALGLDDPPELDRCPQLDGSQFSPNGPAQEARAAFSHVIYMDICRRILLKLPPTINPSLQPKFRQLATLHCDDPEMNFMRAKSALFLADSQQLAATWTLMQLDLNPSASWSEDCGNLIEDIHAHLDLINTPFMEVAFIHELQVITLKGNIIIALSALAELYGLLAPSQPESRQKHRQVVTEIAEISSMFSDRDVQYLDPTLGLCWAIAARRIFDDDPVLGLPHMGLLASAAPNDKPPVPCDIIREYNERLSRAMPFVIRASP
ncbi:hypothetical protein C8J57DRAFT_1304738 [Mycena rebaudengoi]|nr:hypothetical protein C8J57DRAFT_1304738 [Mycena rebaudengoi]